MPVASTCDVLIVGAGPAGTAAAWSLARAGLHVVMVDQQSFPRDKVCGDALIPDALGAIDTMGLRPIIDAESFRVPELRVYAPSGAYIALATSAAFHARALTNCSSAPPAGQAPRCASA